MNVTILQEGWSRVGMNFCGSGAASLSVRARWEEGLATGRLPFFPGFCFPGWTYLLAARAESLWAFSFRLFDERALLLVDKTEPAPGTCCAGGVAGGWIWPAEVIQPVKQRNNMVNSLSKMLDLIFNKKTMEYPPPLLWSLLPE